MPLEDLLVVTGLSAAISLVANIAGASLYDLKRINSRRLLKSHPRARRYRQRPTVSVIVPTYNNAKDIERCLEALVSSSYRKLEIVVIDGCSLDNTAAIVRDFISRHPSKNLQLHIKRRRSSALSVLSSGQRHMAGQLVATLSPSLVIDKLAIAQAVSYFNFDEKVQAVSFNVKAKAQMGSLSQFERLDQLLHYRAAKLRSLLGINLVTPLAPGLYRRAALAKALKAASRYEAPSTFRLDYASDAVAYSGASASLIGLARRHYRRQLDYLQAFASHLQPSQAGYRGKQWLALVIGLSRGLSALLTPILIAYFIYMAVALHEPAFFLACWLAVGIFLSLAVYGDDQLSLKQKLSSSLIIPVAYSLYLVICLVPYFVLLGVCRQTTKQLVSNIRLNSLASDMQPAKR